jgi:hypothetical protein
VAQRLKRAALHAMAAATLALSLACVARAAPTPAKLVWASAGLAYVACPDSNALRVGDRVSFADRGKEVASGRILRVDAGGLTLTRLERGQLDARRWKKLRLSIQRTSSPPLLRLGFASVSSGCFSCPTQDPRAPVADSRYRLELNSPPLWRLVRAVSATDAPGWPDTIEARQFDESADEEIALERGDLDVAMFWPGELSSRLREDGRWWDGSVGIRERVLAVAISLRPDAAGAPIFPASADLLALDRDLFRGDLAPWTPALAETSSRTLPGGAKDARRPQLMVSPSWPGHARIESWWNGSTAAPAGPPPPQIRFEVVSASNPDSRNWLIEIADELRGTQYPPARRAVADSIAQVLRRDAGGSQDLTVPQRDEILARLAARPVYTFGCPVASSSEFRGVVQMLGPDAVVRILRCAPPSGRP